MLPDSEEQFRKGKKYLNKDNLGKAAKAFERAYKADMENPNYMSYYGMCAAMGRGAIGLGLELCTRAIKKEFSRAVFYVNLGKVYLAAGNKKGAIAVIKKGFRYNPESDELKHMLIMLGIRTRPIIPYLKRSNPLNKFLGILFRRTIPKLIGRKRPGRREKVDAATWLPL
jgi:tetratricopeptide (TPR) repeat protein